MPSLSRTEAATRAAARVSSSARAAAITAADLNPITAQMLGLATRKAGATGCVVFIILCDIGGVPGTAGDNLGDATREVSHLTAEERSVARQARSDGEANASRRDVPASITPYR